MTHNFQHPIGCVAVFVLNHEGKVLIGKRTSFPESDQSCFTIPGGKIERMETAHDAAVREVREETGLNIQIVRFLQYKDDIYPKTGWHCLTIYFQAVAYGENPQPRDMEPLKNAHWAWIDPENIPLKLYADAQEAFRKL